VQAAHPERPARQIAAIKEWGWTIAVLVDEAGEIIAGAWPRARDAPTIDERPHPVPGGPRLLSRLSL
jgi:hypothetical protein